VWFSETGWIDTPIYAREHIPAEGLRGPAIIEQLDATTVIDPGAHARGDGYGNLIITL
jgi:N-methylhydantoinase A